MTLIRIHRQDSGVQSFCCSNSLKICLIHSFVSSSHPFMSSPLIPLLSLALPFLRRSMAACISSSVNSGICPCFHLLQLVLLPSSFSFSSTSVLTLLPQSPSYNLQYSPNTPAIPFLDVLTSPFMFLILRSIRVFADLFVRNALRSFHLFQDFF